jgi:F0F1-type ATP synthase membrane subunit b/b'
MNKQRRKQVDNVIKRIEDELGPMIAAIREDIEGITADEQESLDNMPESFQNGEQGELSQNAISHLEDTNNEFDNLDLDYLIDRLNQAQE